MLGNQASANIVIKEGYNMLELLKNASNMEKGLYVMVVGLIGVFSVLILFFLLIKVLEKLFPQEGTSEQE